MPVVRESASLPVRSAGGVTETLAADAEVFGVPVPLRLRHIAVEPGHAASVEVSGDEVMAYVLGGNGSLAVAGEQLALAPESVAWIDPPGAFELHAGGDGLAVLVAEAPGPSAPLPGRGPAR